MEYFSKHWMDITPIVCYAYETMHKPDKTGVRLRNLAFLKLRPCAGPVPPSPMSVKTKGFLLHMSRTPSIGISLHIPNNRSSNSAK